jgi:hypothetical protein
MIILNNETAKYVNTWRAYRTLLKTKNYTYQQVQLFIFAHILRNIKPKKKINSKEQETFIQPTLILLVQENNFHATNIIQIHL